MRASTLEKFQDFFAGKEVTFYDNELEDRNRLLKIIELKMDDVCISDRKVFKKIRKVYEVAMPKVIREIGIVERMIAVSLDKTGDPDKIWTRYLISEVAKEAISLAKKDKDSYKMAYAANVLGKHKLTDKEDIIKPDYSKIIPFKPEMTLDPSILGIKKPENFEALRAKYFKKFDEDYKHFVKKLSIPEAEIIEEDEE